MEKILDEVQKQQFLDLVENAQRVVVCPHVNPDGDAVGSSLAIMHWLRKQGKCAHVVVPNAFPEFLQWLPGADEVIIYARNADEAKERLQQADLVVIADMNSPSRLGAMEEMVLAVEAPRIMIDHHMDPSAFCQLVISQPQMCATAEVWCHVLSQLSQIEHLSYDEAVCLYTAMMCDTGAFTYASNRPVVYECIGLLMACGIDKDKIYRNVFYTASAARLRLQGYLLYVNMQLLNGYHTSIMTLTREERKRFGIKNGDTEGFVNIPLQIMGMRLSVFLTEDTEHPGIVKVSLRSVDDFPCNLMAEEFFNGGGHKNASGGRIQCTMDEAVECVKQAVNKYRKWLKDV